MLLATFMQPGCESFACVPGKSVDDLTLGIIRTGSVDLSLAKWGLRLFTARKEF